MLEEAGELPLLKELPSLMVLRRAIGFTHPSRISDYAYTTAQRGNLDPNLEMPQVSNIAGFSHTRQSPMTWKQYIKLNVRDGTLVCNALEEDPVLMRLESTSSSSVLLPDCKPMRSIHGHSKSNAGLDCSSSSMIPELDSVGYDKQKEKGKQKKRVLKLVAKQSGGGGHDQEEGLYSTSTSFSRISTCLDEKLDDVVQPKSPPPHQHHLHPHFCYCHDGGSHRFGKESDVGELPKPSVLTQFGNILPNCYWLKIDQGRMQSSSTRRSRRRRRRRRGKVSLHSIATATTTTSTTNTNSPRMGTQRFAHANSPASSYIRYRSPRQLKSGSSTPRDANDGGRNKGDSQTERLPLLSDPSMVVATSNANASHDPRSKDQIRIDRLTREFIRHEYRSAFSQGSCDVGFKDKFIHHGNEQNKDSMVEVHGAGTASERCRSLTQKYRPNSLEDLVGQEIVSRTLSSAIRCKEEVHPVYLFHGPGGTGKTSAARVFASALNCMGRGEEQEQESDLGKRPCRVCQRCKFSEEKSDLIREIDSASPNGIEEVKALIRRVSLSSMMPSPSSSSSSPSSLSMSLFKVFIIEECHVLTKDVWDALLKILEKPVPMNLVFILITSSPIEVIPSNVVSVCQCLAFPKIEQSDIMERLQALSRSENLEAEPGALELVAMRADGSLREAEMMLDQLTLLGPKISVSMVHELFGSISEEKLMGLLDLALSSNTISTVLKAREFINSGVEPLDLVVQLMSLVQRILDGSGTSKQPPVVVRACYGAQFFSYNKPLREEERNRLRAALSILSDAEKQLRSTCNDRMTWLTAALLQIGPSRPSIASSSGISESLRSYRSHLRGKRFVKLKESAGAKYKPIHIQTNSLSSKPNFELRYWLAHGDESSEFLHVKKESMVSSTSDALKIVSSHHFSTSSSFLRCQQQQERRYIEVGSLHYWRSGRSERTEYSSGARRDHDDAYSSAFVGGMPSTPDSQNAGSFEIISDSDFDLPSPDADAAYQSYETEEEHLGLKPRCGGLLCWMQPKVGRRE